MLCYYTEVFDWKSNVINIRRLEPMTKLEKMWNTQCLVIEDPFDLTHNLGSGLSKSSKWLFLFLYHFLHIYISYFHKGEVPIVKAQRTTAWDLCLSFFSPFFFLDVFFSEKKARMGFLAPLSWLSYSVLTIRKACDGGIMPPFTVEGRRESTLINKWFIFLLSEKWTWKYTVHRVHVFC